MVQAVAFESIQKPYESEIMKTYQKIYGDKAKEKLISFEAFEVSEYGAYVTQEELCEIFELP